MKANRKVSWAVLTGAILVVHYQLPSRLVADNRTVATEWSAQVDKVVPGNVNIEPAFRVAIYENLLEELAKSGRFQQVLRSGDSRANDIPKLLIVKTTVEAFTPGSEARRAVTTVTGATKLKVRTQFCTRENQVVFERVVDGDVRFFGSNLRATYNLAHHLANAVKQAKLSDPASLATKN